MGSECKQQLAGRCIGFEHGCPVSIAVDVEVPSAHLVCTQGRPVHAHTSACILVSVHGPTQPSSDIKYGLHTRHLLRYFFGVADHSSSNLHREAVWWTRLGSMLRPLAPRCSLVSGRSAEVLKALSSDCTTITLPDVWGPRAGHQLADGRFAHHCE